MPAWDAYPSDYRAKEIRAILAALTAGECVSVVGLSGAGKSNLLGFLYHRTSAALDFALADGNRARPKTADGLLEELGRAIHAPAQPEGDPFERLQSAIAQRLATTPSGSLCLLVDRSDALPQIEQAEVAGPLRALRDEFKYSLTYLIAARRPLDASSELAELFYANTLFLGPLSPADAEWSARQYALRRGLNWDDDTIRRLCAISRGYPSLLRGCCEALTAGCELTEAALKAHPAVARRVEEFWADQPTLRDVQACGLEGHPLLQGKSEQEGAASELTALENRLLLALQARPGEVIEKDDLIRAVWPEDRLIDGLRDDSLAQLVRRLRLKVGPEHIQTIQGRGYRFKP